MASKMGEAEECHESKFKSCSTIPEDGDQKIDKEYISDKQIAPHKYSVNPL